MRKKKNLPLLEQITITDVAAEGKAIARYNDMVIFIPFAVPGDVVDIQITRKKNSYAEGKIVTTHSYSTNREAPFCEHFGICGGCKWQNLPYASQLTYKQKQVYDNLTRIGKIQSFDMLPILGSEQTQFYRNKLEFTFSNKAWMNYDMLQAGTPRTAALGFHIPGMFDKVLHIEKCWLQDEISNMIRNTLHEFCQQQHISYFDLKEQHGMMRNVIVRTSTTGEIMVIVVFYEKDQSIINEMLSYLLKKVPSISSLLYIHNTKANDTISDQEIHVFHGSDHIFEQMEGLKFKIGPKSFYQTNSRQAYELYKITRDFASLTGNELVYDLYTGTGTIANFVANRAQKVIGIEYVPEAIEDAKVNASINNITNTSFFAGDMKDILNESFIKTQGKPDVIITDPPRAGMHDDVIKAILFASPKKIVYVSCNPATQARDILLLSEKYRVIKVQAVDMFPHTHHVESVALLEEKESL
ncbi:MAG TPA: 23S rRNA (uracil(1939)-C(5))-methyltransferase RlmD [Paludibacteraceae bacterium]|nr:23S rRNA (uracil(1939)-C(5))-methyltransferase RlmD [Paludibacteraceae bacterium]HPL94561.1 23S rRNA (uracil(1939)-C(5))-methyltransferase RlmD [Paludibacteraceae bacterium]